MARLPRICIECPNPTKPGTNRCEEHPPPRSPSSRATSQGDWKKVREQALKRDGHRCVLCGKPATQVDHVLAVAHGGGNTLDNARSVCATCNLEARPGYTPRQPANVARKLSELRTRLEQTTNVDASLKIQKEIRGLEARRDSPAPVPRGGVLFRD